MKNIFAVCAIIIASSISGINIHGQNIRKVIGLTTDNLEYNNYLHNLYSHKFTNLPKSFKQQQWQKKDVNSAKVDSIITYSFNNGYLRNIFTYGNNGLLIAHLTQTWKNSWVDSLIYIYAYDQNGYQINNLLKINQSNIWINKQKATFVNDIDGNVLTDLNQTWNGTSWQNQTQDVNTYNDKGLLITNFDQVWKNGIWENKFQNVLEYNSQGAVTAYSTYYWDEILWENYSRLIYTYDAKGNLLSSTFQEGYITGWMNVFTINNSYDVNNRILNTTFRIWGDDNWQNDGLTSNSYDGAGNMTFSIYQQWQNNQWINSSLTQYSYNDNKDWLTILTQLWDGGAWVSNQKVDYSYSDGLVQTNCYAWLSNTWQVADANYQVLLNENGIEKYSYYSYGYLGLVYYSNSITDMHEPKTQDMVLYVYPNPVYGKMNIKVNLESPEFGRLLLTDMRGYKRKLYEGILNSDVNSFSYDVNELPAGTYLLQMETKTKSNQLKVCLIK